MGRKSEIVMMRDANVPFVNLAERNFVERLFERESQAVEAAHNIGNRGRS
jgi:hypothetical protein